MLASTARLGRCRKPPKEIARLVSFHIAAGAAMAALLAFGTVTPVARAGDCPAGKVVASGQAQTPGATKPKGVTDTVVGRIDVAKEGRADQGSSLPPAPPTRSRRPPRAGPTGCVSGRSA